LQHNSDPERLLLTQRTVAAALHMPVTLENTDVRFDEGALTRMEASLFEPTVHQVGVAACSHRVSPMV
jgi:beta-amylase